MRENERERQRETERRMTLQHPPPLLLLSLLPASGQMDVQKVDSKQRQRNVSFVDFSFVGEGKSFV